MAVRPVPDGYHTVTPYIVVEDAGGLIDFIKQAFGVEERMRHTRPDGAIMHAEVQLGDSIIMIGGGSPELPAKPAMLHLYVEDVDALYTRALAAGGASLREPADQFYGDRSAGVSDRWGNEWWIATHIEDVTPEEIERRAQAQVPA
jgi:uncharacterized glyoxalase superfamily protein PhnB